jgi:hypothetical protein
MSDGTGEHGGLPLVLIIAPLTGRLRVLPPKNFHDGAEWVESGQSVAEIETSAGREPVLAPKRGRMGGMMGRDGEPVRQGQPVAWMEALPEGASWIKAVEDDPTGEQDAQGA